MLNIGVLVIDQYFVTGSGDGLMLRRRKEESYSAAWPDNVTYEPLFLEDFSHTPLSEHSATSRHLIPGR
jgi:hypothetical protein